MHKFVGIPQDLTLRDAILILVVLSDFYKTASISKAIRHLLLMGWVKRLGTLIMKQKIIMSQKK